MYDVHTYIVLETIGMYDVHTYTQCIAMNNSQYHSYILSFLKVFITLTLFQGLERLSTKSTAPLKRHFMQSHLKGSETSEQAYFYQLHGTCCSTNQQTRKKKNWLTIYCSYLQFLHLPDITKTKTKLRGGGGGGPQSTNLHLF